MKRRRLIPIALTVIVLMAALLTFTNLNTHQVEHQARQKLDSLLGQQTQPPLPLEEEPERFPPQGFQPVMPNRDNQEMESSNELDLSNGQLPGLPFLIPKTSVDVQESPDQYTLRVPLAAAEDAHEIRLQVEPHHVEISGKTGTRHEGAMMTTSFMQSFSTSEELLPDKVRKKTEQHDDLTEMVIIIPKKRSGQVKNSSQPSRGNHPELSPPGDQKNPDWQGPSRSVPEIEPRVI